VDIEPKHEEKQEEREKREEVKRGGGREERTETQSGVRIVQKIDHKYKWYKEVSLWLTLNALFSNVTCVESLAPPDTAVSVNPV
jgi:hypothetical protein